MDKDVLELKSQNITESALEVSSLLEKSPVFYVRTAHEPKKLIEEVTKLAKSTFAWECIASEEGSSTLVLQKKTSCCGMCH